MEIYLHPKGYKALVASNRSGQGTSAFNSALFNYLLKFDVAGAQLYDSYPPVTGVVVVTSERMFWYVDSLNGVRFLEGLIVGLTNHSVTCGAPVEILTLENKAYHLPHGVYMSEQEYSKSFSLAERTKDIDPVVYYDATSKETFEPFLRAVLKEQCAAVAGPLTEELEVVSFLQSFGKVVSVHQSLMQLVFGHVDACSFVQLREISGLLKRQYLEICEQIDNAEKICGSLWNALGELPVDVEMPLKSSVKFMALLDQNKQPLGKSGIYDIYLSHPRLPVIYRQPFVVETENVEAYQIVGYTCCFMEDAFQYLNRLLKEQEDQINTSFKEYLLGKLLEGQPEHFIGPITQLVQTLKLNVKQYQLDGPNTYGRCVQNIQVACQLRYNDTTQVLYFGRSYVSTPSGFLNVSELGVVKQGLFQVKQSLGVLKAPGAREVDAQGRPVRLQLCSLLYRQGKGAVTTVHSEFDAVLKAEGFTVDLDVQSLGPLKVDLCNTPNSQRYIQLENVKLEHTADEDKMGYSFMRKRMFLCSNNLGLLLKMFGNYLFGWFCNEFFQLQQKFPGTELEGFAIQVDFQSRSALGQFRKLYVEEMAADLEPFNLQGYEFLGFPEEEPEDRKDGFGEKVKQLDASLPPEIVDMQERDLAYVLGEATELDYQDKLLSKARHSNGFLNCSQARKACHLYLLADAGVGNALVLEKAAVVRQIIGAFYGKTILYGQMDRWDPQEMQRLVQQAPDVLILACPGQAVHRILQAASGSFGSFNVGLMEVPLPSVNLPAESASYDVPFSPVHYGEVDFCVYSGKKQPPLCYHGLRADRFSQELGSSTQWLLDTDALGSFLEKLPRRPFAEVTLAELFPLGVALSLGMKLVAESGQLKFARQPTLRQVNGMLRANASLFQPLHASKALLRLEFRNFALEILGTAVFFELNPGALINKTASNIVRLWASENASNADRAVGEVFMRALVLCIENEFCDVSIKAQESPKLDPSWETIRLYYAEKPLPSGWFYDCGRYMDWNGNISADRPDKEELILLYQKEHATSVPKPKKQ